MTFSEARDFYQKRNCSYFAMCDKDYSDYVAYKRLGVTKEMEKSWKNERLQTLYDRFSETGDETLFFRMYEIAETFHDYEKLMLLTDVLKYIKQPIKISARVSVAETILGKRLPEARSGMVYWAYDIGEKELAEELIFHAKKYLNISYVTEIKSYRRMLAAKRLCRKLSEELKSEQEKAEQVF